jgi:hypothetical protein
MDNIKLQYYLGGVKVNQPTGLVDLETFLERTENPSDKISKLFSLIAEASEKGDKKRKAELKAQLPFVTPAVTVKKYRRYEDIVSFTGLTQIDFDGIDNASDLKHHLFQEFPQFLTVYTSPSLKGVKGLMRIPICKSVEEYQDYYRAIQETFEGYYGFDPAPKNAVLPLFLSWDEFLLKRDSPTVWDKKKVEEKSFHQLYPLAPRPYNPSRANDKNRSRAINTFRKMVNQIVDNGHPQLRSASLILGTRVGAGYVPRFEAEQEAETAIRNSRYLAKGIKGYTTTAKWAIEEGIKTPKFY